MRRASIAVGLMGPDGHAASRTRSNFLLQVSSLLSSLRSLAPTATAPRSDCDRHPHASVAQDATERIKHKYQADLALTNAVGKPKTMNPMKCAPSPAHAVHNMLVRGLQCKQAICIGVWLASGTFSRTSFTPRPRSSATTRWPPKGNHPPHPSSRLLQSLGRIAPLQSELVAADSVPPSLPPAPSAPPRALIHAASVLRLSRCSDGRPSSATSTQRHMSARMLTHALARTAKQIPTHARLVQYTSGHHAARTHARTRRFRGNSRA